MSSRVRSTPAPGVDGDDAAAGLQHAEQEADGDRPVAQEDADLGAGLGHERRRLLDGVGELAVGPPVALELDGVGRRVDGEDLGDPRRQCSTAGRRRHRSLGSAFGRRVGGDLGLADRVAEPRVDEALLHGRPVGPVERLPDGAHGALGGGAGLGGDAGGDLVGPRPELGALDHLGDEADLQRGLGGDPLVVAHQRDAQRLGQADLAHQPDRLERADQAVGDVRVEEGGVGRADDDVGLVEEVEGAGRADALHRAHHRLPAPSATWG